MLHSGAEDYIIKPIVATLFTNRLHNYLRIIQSRNTIGFKHNAINTFTSTIYNYVMDFTIATEDELAQFWETALIRFEMQRMIPDIHEVTRFLHRLGTIFLHYKYSFHIFLEEDKENFYMSMNHIKLLEQTKVEKLIADHYLNALYNIKGDTLTFLLHKASEEDLHYEPIKSSPIAEKEKPQPTSTEEKTETIVPKVEPEKPVEKVIEELTTYHFLDPDELDDLNHSTFSRFGAHGNIFDTTAFHRKKLQNIRKI